MKTLKKRLLKMRSISKKTGCWNFMGGRCGAGYGCIRINKPKRAMINAHRAAWLVFKGPIRAGFYVLHKCDNKKCFNIRHLFLGTQKTNMRDFVKKNRFYAARGEDHGHVKITYKQVLLMRRIYRPGKMDYVMLAARFGITPTTARAAVIGKTWKHV